MSPTAASAGSTSTSRPSPPPRCPTSGSSSATDPAGYPTDLDLPRVELVGIDVILVHRLLKNAVPLREHVLMTEELAGGADEVLPEEVRQIEPDVEGVGPVGAYVDVTEVERVGHPRPDITWGGCISRTLDAAGAGLPYVLGRRGRGRVAVPSR